MQVFLSHDVDWPKSGPGRDHILARRDRFDKSVLERVISFNFNPYYGIGEFMRIEKDIGVRSTFFFRPWFDDATTAREYHDDIRALTAGGWEVGVHLNDTSSDDSISKQKSMIDSISGVTSKGTRVHYLRIDLENVQELEKFGLQYDSSISFSKNSIDQRNAGFLKLGSVVEFPITFMDAYLFSYMGVKEESLVDFVIKNIRDLKLNGIQLATILWHDNVLYMRGGRKYEQIIKSLYSIDGIQLQRGIDVLSNLPTRNA